MHPVRTNLATLGTLAVSAITLFSLPVSGQTAPHSPRPGGPGDTQPAAAFRPGQLWPDSRGVPINCHGGGILYHDGLYWWFGQHMAEGTAGNQAMVGVHVYASSDLDRWQDRGIALAVCDDPQSEIARGCILERPKVLFNRKTRQFVMWFHLELKGQGSLPTC